MLASFYRIKTIFLCMISATLLTCLSIILSTPMQFTHSTRNQQRTITWNSSQSSEDFTSYGGSLTKSDPTSSPGVTENVKQCLPHNHVMFLKTHKCASTTVQNIFLRYGVNNNLTFALPHNGNYLGNPGIFTRSLVWKDLLPPDGKVDIFALHTRLNFQEHVKVLHDDTKWVTIVREPASLYESLFEYYMLDNIYDIALSNYSTIPLKKLEELPRFGGRYGRNQMLFDLGYRESLSVAEVRRAIERLDQIFDLVMLVEFMDESLIFLRHLLCWSLHDVVVLTKNARRKEFKIPLETATTRALKDLNGADSLLYDHFLAKHRQKVLEFGKERMADEVASLRSLRDTYFDICDIREVKSRRRNIPERAYTNQVRYFVASNQTNRNCPMLTKSELRFIDYLRFNQRKLLLKNTNRVANQTENVEWGHPLNPRLKGFH